MKKSAKFIFTSVFVVNLMFSSLYAKEQSRDISNQLLKGFKGLTFVISIPNDLERKETIDVITKTLKQEGEVKVIHLDKGIDFSGMALGNLSALSIKRVQSQSEIYQISLSLSAKATLDTNREETYANVWNMEEFVDLKQSSKKIIPDKFKELLGYLVDQYFSANPNMKGKVIFYIYD